MSKQKYIIWKSDYNIGVEEIDIQHKKVIAIINMLYNHLGENRKDHVELTNLIHLLIHYTNVHFATEESYFEVFGYFRAAEHKHEHDTMKVKTHEITQKILHQESEQEDLLKFLKEWWLSHILKLDMDYKNFLKNKNLDVKFDDYL